MERGKRTAIALSLATVVGVPAAEVRDHLDALHVSNVISPDAGAVAGTAAYQVADLGFVTLDSRAPVEVRQGRYAYRDPYYRGGSIT
jgi:hypothetical protein